MPKVVMVYHYFRFTKASIDRLENCKAIVRPGVGYDGIDCEAARSRGIPVCNVPDYGTEEVADSAMGMAISLARGSHFLNSRLRRGVGEWNMDQAAPISRLRGQTFGIIGCGRIGTATALRAKAFGFDVLFYDPYLPDGVERRSEFDGSIHSPSCCRRVSSSAFIVRLPTKREAWLGLTRSARCKRVPFS